MILSRVGTLVRSYWPQFDNSLLLHDGAAGDHFEAECPAIAA
jgi:hypothetical protein